MKTTRTLPGSLLRGGLSLLGRGRLAQIEGRQTVAGLESEVEILRDRWGIAHLYAKNDHDLFFAQGLVHAQERLWQMELHRRTALGTLSEMLGEIALETDRAARTFGFGRLGRVDWQQTDPDLRGAVEAYTAGVNACMALYPNKLPVEFTLLRTRPRPWTTDDTMAFSRFMFWQLSHAWYSEIVRAQLIEKVGAEHFAEIDINYPAENPITLPKGIEFNRLDPAGGLPGARGPFIDRGKGSNAWALAGWRSETGAPILCNDMHLVQSVPGLWYEMHLESPNFNVSGVSLPALPMILVGHNQRVAWGITLAFTDAEDLYIEKFDPENPRRYEYMGAWHEAEVVRESIPVKGRAEPHVEEVLVTRHGPVISDVIDTGGKRLAVQSMALRPARAFHGWMMLDRAANWQDFEHALEEVSAPQLNICYADVDGNIGYRVTGRTPVRAKGDGGVPAPGWSGEYEWVGEIPFAEMPHVLNPEKGYVVTCNNKVMPDDYPHFLGNAWMNGYRANRLSSMIEQKERLTWEDCRSMQTDVTSLPGRQFVDCLAGFASEDADVKLALKLLRAWDGQLSADSVGGTVYEVVRYTLERRLLEPVLGKDLTDAFIGKAFNPVLYTDHEFFGNDTPALLRMLQNKESWWLERAGGRQAALETAIKQAVVWLRGELGADAQGWKWGDLHAITFPHALGIQKPLDEVFNVGPFPLGGDTDTPWQTAMAPGEPYQNRLWSPSMRQIVDLGDLTRSRFVLPVGQSGQLGSKHYADMVPMWLKGEYHPMLWTRQQVEAELEGRLVLSPTAGG